MESITQFIVAALALLMTPGPTNSLLLTGGATVGGWRAAHLVTAETLGYAVSITAQELLIVPLTQHNTLIRLILRLACGIYLAFVALQLWTVRRREGAAMVSWQRLLMATISNPKSMVLSFVIMPPRSIGIDKLVWPYGTVLIGLILLAGGCWVILGAIIHDRFAMIAELPIQKASSIVMALFSTSILISALMPQAA